MSIGNVLHNMIGKIVHCAYLCHYAYLVYFQQKQKGAVQMPASKADQRAVNKYVKNHYDRITVTVPKGRRAEIQAHAESMEESTNGFITRAIQETIERDQEEKQDAPG